VRTVEVANMTLRLVLEMCALSLLAFWSFHAVGRAGAGWHSASVWPRCTPPRGIARVPKAPASLSQPMKVGVQMTLLLLPAAALLHLGKPAPAGSSAALLVGNAVLLHGGER